MDYDDLTPEQRERVKACKSAEELVALAKEYGVELTDEQAASVSGGDNEWYCPCNQPGAYACYID